MEENKEQGVTAYESGITGANETNTGMPEAEAPKAAPKGEEPKKMSFVTKLIIGCVGLLVVLVLLMVIISNHKTKVDLSKYVTITYSGYNTVGHASAEVDYTKLSQDFGKQLQTGDSLSDIAAGLAFYAVATGKLDKTEGLSNGDEVVFTWNESAELDELIKNFENKYKLKLVFKDVKGKVEGLESASIYDPFESVTLTFSGYSSLGKVSIDTGAAKIKGLRYTISPETNLSNGDEVTVLVSTSGSTSLEDYCLTYGYVPGQREKTYTVSGLEEIQEVDLFAGLEISFEGVSTIGTAKSDNSKVELNQISYTVEPYEGLANGDTVTVTASYGGWSYDSIDSYLANNGYKTSTLTKTYTVSGLKEAEAIDPFDNIDVVFSGISSDGRAAIENNNDVLTDLSFNLSESYDLSNGDEVTVTISAPWWADSVEAYCLENGYVLSETEKTYEVSGLDYYIYEISQIPDDVIDDMDEQIIDHMKAKVASGWTYKDSLKKMTLMGCYLLYPKDMDNRSSANYLYLVYKMDVQNEKSGKFSYYYYAEYRDILCTSDGDIQYELMNFNEPGDSFKKDSLWYYGYEKLSELYNKCVTTKIDRYKCETNIEE